jgi:hypothetical protein
MASMWTDALVGWLKPVAGARTSVGDLSPHLLRDIGIEPGGGRPAPVPIRHREKTSRATIGDLQVSRT